MRFSGMIILLFFLGALACGKRASDSQEAERAVPKQSLDTAGTSMPEYPPAAHIEVQHILIAFKGTIRKPQLTRTREDAQQLALELFARAQQGEDFDHLVEQYSDDEYPGRYRMANLGVQAGAGEFPRSGMVKAFGDVSFRLAVGEIGMAHYDPQESKYGWHIIKRLK